jgi:hypothetical protein
MATFGNTVETWDGSSYAADSIWMGKFTLAEAGDVSKLTAFVDAWAPCAARGVIYADSSGKPGTLLGAAETLFETHQTPYWADFTFATAIALTAGDYWLGVHLDANEQMGLFRLASAGTSYNAWDTYADGTATTCPASAPNTHLYLIYATYSTTPSGISIPLLNHLLLGD